MVPLLFCWLPIYWKRPYFTSNCSCRASQDPSSTSVSPSLKELSLDTMTATKGPEHEVIPSFILLYLISDWKNEFRALLYLKVFILIMERNA